MKKGATRGSEMSESVKRTLREKSEIPTGSFAVIGGVIHRLWMVDYSEPGEIAVLFIPGIPDWRPLPIYETVEEANEAAAAKMEKVNAYAKDEAR